MLEQVARAGFEVEFHSHARAIFQVDLRTAADELEAVLLRATIPIVEIVAGGGGEAKGTQRLRRGLAGAGWTKRTFTIEKRINGEPRESISHEVDHVREIDTDGSRYVIALEIEWNNKDPFFDRDLENFKRLHAEGAISVGVIVTRGASLQDEMRTLIRRFVDEQSIGSFDDLARFGYLPTLKQRTAIQRRVDRPKDPLTFRDAFVDKFVSDKFGQATTHWRKLQERIRRGVGNPCPLLLIGMPSNIVRFEANQEVIREVARAQLDEDDDA